MTQRQGREEFTRGAVANRGVVPEFEAALQDFCVLADKPAEAKAGQAVGLAHGTEADRAFVDFASCRKARGGIVFKLAVDFVAKNDNSKAGRELHDLLEDARRHEKSCLIVRRVDIDDFRVRLKKFLESGEIVRPAVFVTAAPLADLRSSAARNF